MGLVNSGARAMLTVMVTAFESRLPCALLSCTRNIAPLAATGRFGVCSEHGLAQAVDVVLLTIAQLPLTKRCKASVTGPVPA